MVAVPQVPLSHSFALRHSQQVVVHRHFCIYRPSIPEHVYITQRSLRVSITLVRGHIVQPQSLLRVLLNPLAPQVAVTQISLPQGQPLVRSQAEPPHGLPLVRRHPLALLVYAAQVPLGVGVALRGAQAVQPHGLDAVHVGAPAAVVARGQVVLGDRGAQRRGLAVVLERLPLVRGDPAAGAVAVAQVAQRHHVAAAVDGGAELAGARRVVLGPPDPREEPQAPHKVGRPGALVVGAAGVRGPADGPLRDPLGVRVRGVGGGLGLGQELLHGERGAGAAPLREEQRGLEGVQAPLHYAGEGPREGLRRLQHSVQHLVGLVYHAL
ncbi:hypothetical protein Pelo_1323 [Pelomyxa schiedti]|nr:hypothetical protein Pelo_1323 [Pelomyxa schiedti]